MRFLIAMAAMIVLLASGTAVCAGQENSVMKFDDHVWEMGTIRESEGPITHTFTYVNTGKEPMVIERVQNSCGCTSTKFSREPIAPGEKGSLEVTFNPQDFSGRTSRTVLVFNPDGYTTLYVNGFIIPMERPLEENYPYSLGNGLRVDMLHQAFGFAENGKTISMVAEIINVTEKPVYIKVMSAIESGKLKVNAPARLGAGEKGVITLTYDLTEGEPVYGMLSDAIYLIANGAEAKLAINANAIATDAYSEMDPEKAPMSEVSPNIHYFENSRRGASLTKEFTLRNTGRSPLIVRYVNPRKNTQTDLKEGTTLNPGQVHKFNITLNVSQNLGHQRGGIVIVTNDPTYSYREIRVLTEAIK